MPVNSVYAGCCSVPSSLLKKLAPNEKVMYPGTESDGLTNYR